MTEPSFAQAEPVLVAIDIAKSRHEVIAKPLHLDEVRHWLSVAGFGSGTVWSARIAGSRKAHGIISHNDLALIPKDHPGGHRLGNTHLLRDTHHGQRC